MPRALVRSPRRASRIRSIAAVVPRVDTPGPFVALSGLLLLAGLSVYRAGLVDASFGNYVGCNRCLDGAVWTADGLFFAMFPGALCLACLVGRGPARALLASVVLLAVLFYTGDIVVYRLLTHRLLLADALHFAGDAALLGTVLSPFLAEREGALLVLVSVAAAATLPLAILACRPGRDGAIAWLALAAALFAAAWASPHAEYIHDVSYRNVWQVNAEVDPTRPYTSGFVRALGPDHGKALVCDAGLERRPSVIVVAAESLSSYHSQLFSGLNDYTPHLDRWAQRESYFPDFVANGYSTETGLISLLTGRVPIPTAGSFGSTLAFTEVEGDFHRWLATQGYRTAFFTSGNLRFGNRQRWLAAIGIGRSEGAEHPHYQGMPRGVFGAAGDDALLDRFLEWYHAEGRRAPFMATILTVRTHPPYAREPGADGSERDAFRRLDRQLNRFLLQLERDGFLRRGIVLVVGDHRAMTALGAGERERLGAAAAMRVPAIAIGATGLPRGAVKLPFQQVDLIPSLRHLIDRHACLDEWQGRFLGSQPRPARYVAHGDPLRRNEMVFHEAGGEARLLLDGDDTRWLRRPGDAGAAERQLRRVNLERISRMTEFGYRPPP